MRVLNDNNQWVGDGQTIDVGQHVRQVWRCKMTDALAIISEYIQMLQTGHVKEGLREASKQEIEFGTALLQAVAADIEARGVK